MNKLLITGLLLATLVGCAHQQQAMLVSGETLVHLADVFVVTAETMDKGLENNTITEEQYGKWVIFGSRFQQLYPASITMWQVARASGDKELEASVILLINQLAAELMTFGGTL